MGRHKTTMKKIYCVACNGKVEARLTTGEEVYAHRPDLHSMSFWKCDDCGNFVGCHKHTTNPLGCIPTPELKKARMQIHAVLDPIWKARKMSRNRVYGHLSNKLGREYHTAQIRSLNEAERVLSWVKELSAQFASNQHTRR